MRYGGPSAGRSLLVLVLRSCGTVLTVGALMTAAALHSASPVDATRHRLPGAVPWKDSWSQRYPGCVSVLLWPQDERPVAVVARRPDGTVTRVLVHGSDAAAAVPSGARTVGACR